MRHRLFFVFPEVENARRALDELLLARIEARHVHFMTGGGPLPDDLPEASVLQKTDIVSGAEHGMAAGAILGLLLGLFVVWYFDLGSRSAQATAVVVAASAGLLFGGWAASLVAAALPNSRLKSFYDDLDQGRILMMVDVPASRVTEIERLLRERHPETRYGGRDWHTPVFP
ncbi:MAG: hypothetical protein JWP36_1562 [Paucimonas sp.]|nr:hypothetical protein [Paucimonas sp.]